MLTSPDLPVDARDLSVAVAGRPVLRRVDLRVGPGEVVALMGANGSGKSTLVRALTGLRPAVSGTVELFGTPLAAFRDWGRVGLVPQRQGAESGVPASVREVVAAGRLPHRRLLRPSSRADRRAVDAALETVELAHLAAAGVATLSGGQQQRVLVARALAGEPDLLLLDEPMAGVDLPHQQSIAASLGRLKAHGASILLVAHELGPVSPLVDRSVVMRDGRVTYDGAPLADHEVHSPGVAQAHLHHRAAPERHDHAPHVGGPFEGDADPGYAARSAAPGPAPNPARGLAARQRRRRP